MLKFNRFMGLIQEEGVWGAIPRLGAYTADKFTIWRNKSKFLGGSEPVMLDLRSNTAETMRRKSNRKNWSRLNGDHWTLAAKRMKGLDPNLWKASLIDQVMKKYIRGESAILEIGPGAGRWTEFLVELANRLFVVDVSERCIEVCRERFKLHSNVEYHVTDGADGWLNFIPSGSIDYVWSYDVFVHINPTDIEAYINDFQRVLRPGGHAVIHHAGYLSEKDRRAHGRSFMTGEIFARLVENHDLRMIEQDTSSSHNPTDIISVFSK